MNRKKDAEGRYLWVFGEDDVVAIPSVKITDKLDKEIVKAIAELEATPEKKSEDIELGI